MLRIEHIAKTFLQFPCRLVGKGDRHDFPRQAGGNAEVSPRLLRQRRILLQIRFAGVDVGVVQFHLHETAVVGIAVTQNICNTVDEHSCFSAARTGQNQVRTVYGKHRFPLAVVHSGKFFF